MCVKVERVQGSDPAQHRIREVWSHLQDGTIDQSDWKLLLTRSASRLSREARALFETAPFLVSTHATEDEINTVKPRDLHKPIARIDATNSSTKAKRANIGDAGGLQQTRGWLPEDEQRLQRDET